MSPEPRVDVQGLERRLATAVNVLEQIRFESGAVCSSYETCAHRSCQASYAAWALADSYLSAGPEEAER